MGDSRAERPAGGERGVVVKGAPVAADRAEHREICFRDGAAASPRKHIPDGQLIEILVQQNAYPSLSDCQLCQAPKSYIADIVRALLNKRSLANTICA